MRRILLIGPPGTGKTRRARQLAAELPSPTGGDLVSLGWLYQRLDREWREGDPAPFRAPHYTVSEAGLTGSFNLSGRVRSTFGRRAYPGEASLAHAGCLFLDELAEFRASAIEGLAHVLRAGRYFCMGSAEERIADPHAAIDMPARPALLVASVNPCPCGYLGTTVRACQCGDKRIGAYRDRWRKLASALGGPWELEACPLYGFQPDGTMAPVPGSVSLDGIEPI